MNYHVLEMELQNDAYDGKSPRGSGGNAQRQKRCGIARALGCRHEHSIPNSPPPKRSSEKSRLRAESSKLLRDVNSWLNDPGGQYPGIDIGDAGVQAMVASLTGVLTADEIEAIQSLGFVLVSRAEQLGIGVVKPGHVTKARAINA